MSRITVLNLTRTPLQGLAFGMACILLFASSQVLADDAEEISAHLMQAELALENDQYQEAAAEYRKAAELSDDPGIAQQATVIGYSYGFDEEALKSAKRWAKLDRESDEALLYVAQLYLRTGEIRKSQRSFEKLLKRGREPADERLLALIPFLSQEDASLTYELMLKLAKPYKKSAAANYAVAVMALQAGETETASERAKAAIEIEPDWVKPHLLHARAMLMSGDEAGAIDYTSRLVGDDPDPDPEARLELAIMLMTP
jgi:tetratricopeptide (TPR) repeat protein